MCFTLHQLIITHILYEPISRTYIFSDPHTLYVNALGLGQIKLTEALQQIVYRRSMP